MTQFTSALDEKSIAVLDSVAPSDQTGTDVNTLNTTRLVQAFRNAWQKTEQISDPVKARDRKEQLLRSSVNGSFVSDIKTLDDVVTMIEQSNDWKIVIANLADKGLICFQGVLPASYVAQAAYATVREIDLRWPNGLDSIRFRRGYQKEGAYYRCTILPMPTQIITFQLRLESEEEGSKEEIKQWFAGYEVSSVYQREEGDEIVRVGVAPLNKHSFNGAKRIHRKYAN